MGRVATVTCVLLTWLCVACGGAESGGQSSPSEAALVSLRDTLELFWEAVGRTVSAAAGASCGSLQTRLDSVQTRLESQLESRLDAVQTRLESELGSVRNQLESRMSSIQTWLEGELGGVRSELQSALPPARDCSDLPTDAVSGVHLLQPGLGRPVPAFCDQDMDGGGWTVFQRRADIEPRQDFYLGWEAYKWGFGELDVEFWWGLQNLWLTTSLLDRRYQIRFDLEDFDGERRYAVYQGFRVASEEDGYRLAAANYTGNAGDSFKYQFDQQFSTKDRDQDSNNDNCARRYKGAWWYNSCHHSNLNGLYLSGNHSSYADGVDWVHWRGHHYSLKSTQMKIKPSKKL